jgi:DNA-binding CsgD family transcriptional regulator
MSEDDTLIGREHELAELRRRLAAAHAGRGGLVLLAGEAGVGKTRLVEAVLDERGSPAGARAGHLVLRGEVSQEATPPYGPVIAALRAYLRVVPDGLRDCGPLCRYLGTLLPELGQPPEVVDRATLFEAIRSALATIASCQPTIVVLDDLHWADNATLELLPTLAAAIEQMPLLVIGVYRNDEIPRGHRLRRLRTDLRRAGRLHEIPIEPLDRTATVLLAARVLGQRPSASLAALLYDRTQGVPFFIEELVGALAAGGRLLQGPDGLKLAAHEQVPIPNTVRDAVLLRADGLSKQAWSVLEVAAVIGQRFDLELVAELAGSEEGLEEPLMRGLVTEVEPGRAIFRHALTREAVYGDVAWPRRRALHRQIAERLEARGAQPGLVAEHWLAARELEAARAALLLAAEAFCAVHAYRDAADASRRALELWPEGADEHGRLDALDRMAHCAELTGDLPAAAHAWRDVVDGRRASGALQHAAQAGRRLAAIYELQGAWERALAARDDAAAAFAASGLPGEAAAERLAAAAHLRSAGSFTPALEQLALAADEAAQSGREDLRARILGLEGNVRSRLGQIETGLRAVRAGLSLALERNLAGAAAEVYQRLADSLEHAADYAAARAAYLEGTSYCEANAVAGTGQVCLACLSYVLRQIGEWDRAMLVCRDLLAASDAPAHAHAVAAGMLGCLRALRGETARARPHLLAGKAQARHLELASVEMLAEHGLAMVDELEGAGDLAAERCRAVLQRWERTEDRHYAVPPLRWATSFFASRGAGADARACADALARIATSGNPEALAGLAHALGECALLDGDARQAVDHFGQALDLLRDLDLPAERVQTQLRAGVALAAAGERGLAAERLAAAYRTARKLGARPLATRTAQQLETLGERVERRLGRRAARALSSGGLSRRELEVLRLVGVGRTNREIGQELFLSPRTVDMHVSSILGKLDCRTRAEAIHKAGDLGLLQPERG